MEERSQVHTTLHLISQPAFLVEDGIISHVNQAAAALLLQPGQPFLPMIGQAEAEYAEFQTGSLFLTLQLAGQSMDARIFSDGTSQIVTLSPPDRLPQLQALELAATELRTPLNAMLSLILQSTGETTLQQSQMNRRIFQMLRVVNNMSDAASYSLAQPGSMESVNLRSLMREILDKAADAIAQCGFHLDYELPQAPIFTLADPEKLERAIYNLLSNACKYAPKETAIHVKVTCKNKRIAICVSNQFHGTLPHNSFNDRFLRQPGFDITGGGLGLGMLLVRAVATAHGGTVLIDQISDTVRVTMTMRIKTADNPQLCSPASLPDYGGEFDHCLLELADVLPPALYTTENL